MSVQSGQLPNRSLLCHAPILIFLISTIVSAQDFANRTGVVTDQNGAAIGHAAIRLASPESGKIIAHTETDDDGRFALRSNAVGILIVEAAGFGRSESRLAEGSTGEIIVVLSPAAVSEIVTVTGIETRLENTPASVVVLGRRELDSTAAATLDDRLRQVPGFSLFRRAGSRTANPTTQGVSLRGVGASGASRALVLADDVPLNDPFGGWIYWGRVPAESVQQVEVLRGPASDLYGGSAVGGVVSLTTRKPEVDHAVSLEASYGNERTPMFSGFASAGISKWRGSLATEVFRTDGFVAVARAERGPIDTAANVRRSVFVPVGEYVFGERRRVYGSAELYQEARANGTPLQNNDTNLRNFSAGADWTWTDAGALTIKAYGGTQNYHQSFSAIAADRRTESLNRLQRVPSQVLGFTGQWTGNLRRNIFIAGLDLRQVRGRSDETVIVGGRPTSLVSSGGHEMTTGLFGGAVVPLGSRLVVSGGLRFDRWQNWEGYTATRSLVSGATGFTDFRDRTESAFSPRASALFRINNNLSLTGTFARAFRRPTLNELYRAFRVGNVLTLANENLRAELATDAEAAVIASGFRGRLYFRGGVFCTKISQPVSNVTLTVTPSLITRQRQNLGRTRSCGVETDGQMKLTSDFSVSGGYLFVDSRVVSFPVNPELVNLRIPQVAAHQFTFQAEYSNPHFVRAAVQLRASSSQFDDDQNLFRLAGYFTSDALVSRKLNRNFDIFAAAENLFNSKIESGRTPVLTLASPRNFRIGLRVRFGGK
jgi:outer membrane receptor protein involved in Fe transport